MLILLLGLILEVCTLFLMFVEQNIWVCFSLKTDASIISTLIQVFAIEFVSFAVDFVPFAVEFVAFAIEFGPFAIEFVAFALEFVGFAVEFGAFALEFVAFAYKFVIVTLAATNQLLITRWTVFTMENTT